MFWIGFTVGAGSVAGLVAIAYGWARWACRNDPVDLGVMLEPYVPTPGPLEQVAERAAARVRERLRQRQGGDGAAAAAVLELAGLDVEHAPAREV